MPYGFRQEDFIMFFPFLSQCKICDPRERGHFLPNLNKLSRGPQGDATY